MASSPQINISLESALKSIRHRGPDAWAESQFIDNNYILKLGHTRLSIIDLEERSNQPFESKCGNYTIVFNGEIYNYKELKKDLLSDCEFISSSDTEVLLNLFIKYGPKILNNLDGMFSFCIFNKTTHEIFCARDQLGIKPFYFKVKKDVLYFASEIKAIEALCGEKSKISNYALYEFLRNSFVYEPETGFEDVLKLGHAEYFIYNLREPAPITPQKYWIPQNKELNAKYTLILDDQKLSLENKIRKSISIQKRSDVPVGLFFSGGVDSTILLSELKDSVKSFTLKSSSSSLKKAGMSDDFSTATEIARDFKLSLSELSLENFTNKDNFLDQVKRVAKSSEELLADFTFLPSKELSRQAKASGCTVILSGMGADELFGGYSKYKLLIYPVFFKTVYLLLSPLLALIPSFEKKFDRFGAFCKSKDFPDQYTSILGYFHKEEIRSLFLNFKAPQEIAYKEKINALTGGVSSPYKKAVVADLSGFLAHNFSVADKSSMLSSVELRVPLATKELFETSFQMKEKSLLNLFKTKIPLRAMLIGIVNKKVLNRKKAGFHPPMDRFIYEVGQEKISGELRNTPIYKYIRRELTEEMLNTHFSRKKNHTYKIFQLLYLGYWLEENLEN